MIIDVYADVVCPWCYIGERRLARALERRPELPVERRWRPFQLQPAMPPGGLPWREFAQRKFGGLERAMGAFAQVTTVGQGEGITFDFARVASAPNTVDAHRLILLAGRSGRMWPMAEALFAAYFAHGRDLNDVEDLVATAIETGLEAEAVRTLLTSDKGRAEVAADQAEAEALGITGVPCYVIDGRYAITGAQPVEVLVRVLDLVAGEMVPGRSAAPAAE
jgi:predicted DsbA family dithiol-disulfide isomerase